MSSIFNTYVSIFMMLIDGFEKVVINFVERTNEK